jgi:hypothetical protein
VPTPGFHICDLQLSFDRSTSGHGPMFGRLIQRIRFRRAARCYARLLGPRLARDYGGSAQYTPAQIATAVNKLNLPSAYLCLGQAVFLSDEQFKRIGADESLGSYAELRRLFVLYRPARSVSAGFGQPPEVPYDVGPFGHT